METVPVEILPEDAPKKKVRPPRGGSGIAPAKAEPLTPLAILDAAVRRGVDADQLGKLMDLAERWNAARAVEAYNAAMAACQAEMPGIVRTKDNRQTNSKYAPFESMNEIIKPIYTRHGFSLGFTEIPQEKETTTMRIACDVRHAAGHTVRHVGDYPRDDVGIKGTANKTPIWGVGSSHSYAKRYLCKDIFCLAECNEDKDGQDTLTLSEEQVKEIEDLLKRSRREPESFWRWVGTFQADCKTVPDILRVHFGKVGDMLERAAKQAEGGR